MEQVLVEEVKTMLDLGVIEPSTSEWRSYPVLCLNQMARPGYV